jgi:rubrerythrin
VRVNAALPQQQVGPNMATIVLDRRSESATLVPHAPWRIIVIDRRGCAHVAEQLTAWFCTVCGYGNAGDDKRCRQCGTPRTP